MNKLKNLTGCSLSTPSPTYVHHLCAHVILQNRSHRHGLYALLDPFKNGGYIKCFLGIIISPTFTVHKYCHSLSVLDIYGKI